MEKFKNFLFGKKLKFEINFVHEKIEKGYKRNPKFETHKKGQPFYCHLGRNLQSFKL
jgi:hypothetical protein